MSDWYEVTGSPGTKSKGESAVMRAEFNFVQEAFDKMPILVGMNGKPIFVNMSASGLESVDNAEAADRLGLKVGRDVQAWTQVLQDTDATFNQSKDNKLGFISVTQNVDLDGVPNGTIFGNDHDGVTGEHKAIKLQPVADPSPGAGKGALFVKAFNGRPELYWRGHGLDPTRMTYNGELSIDLSKTDVEFGSIRTNSYVRGRVIDVPVVAGVAIIDWEAATVYRITISGNTEVRFENMPDTGAGEEQCIYIDLYNGGAFVIDVTSSYDIEWPGRTVPSFTTGGRDYILAASNNGTTITAVAILDIGVGVGP